MSLERVRYYAFFGRGAGRGRTRARLYAVETALKTATCVLGRKTSRLLITLSIPVFVAREKNSFYENHCCCLLSHARVARRCDPITRTGERHVSARDDRPGDGVARDGPVGSGKPSVSRTTRAKKMFANNVVTIRR